MSGDLLHRLWQTTLPCAFNRWRHRHGFGVQSPWAYSLVSDALFEPLRYYAFDTLGGTRADEQLFRLAVWLPAGSVLMGAGISASGRRYLAAARPTLVVEDYDAARIDSRTVLVVEDIRASRRSLWRDAVLPRPDRTSAFDLGHRGIAFFSPARQRQVYYL